MNEIEWDDAKKPTGDIVWDAPKKDRYTATAQDDSNLQNLGASIGGAMMAPVIGVKQLLGKTTPEEIKQWKDSMAGLWSTPMGKVGTLAGGVATAAPLALVPGAATIPGAALGGLAYGAAQPVGEGETRAANAVEGMGGNVAGLGVGKALGAVASKLFTGKTAELLAQKTANAPRDATLAAAQEAGYVFPPSQVNPSIVNRAAEGFAGKLSTAQQMSAKNQNLTTTLAKKSVGIPEEAPLTLDTIRAARSEAAKAYEPVKQFGEFVADKEYAQDLSKIASKYDAGHGGMASLRNKEVESLLQDASTVKMESSNAVEFLRNLREEGFANKSPVAGGAQKKLGNTQIDIANAIEGLMERSLKNAGQTDALDAFRTARTQMARTFTLEKAFDEATGQVDASKLGAMFRKGKPLSNGLDTIGRTAAAFPAAMKLNKTSMPGISPLDYMGGLLGAGAVGPAAALGVFARPVVRSGILSNAYQKAMVNPPSYDVGLLGKGAAGLADNEATRKLLQSLGMSLPAIQQ